MHTTIATLERFKPAAPTMLRLVIGLVFVWHGIDKFDAGISNIEGMFDTWGVPAPGIAAPLSAITEIVAGAALILGLGTRFAAAALSALILGALLYVKQDLGIISSQPMPGAELDLTLLAGLVSLIFLGPGFFSLDQQLGLEPSNTLAEANQEPVVVMS